MPESAPRYLVDFTVLDYGWPMVYDTQSEDVTTTIWKVERTDIGSRHLCSG